MDSEGSSPFWFWFWFLLVRILSQMNLSNTLFPQGAF